MILGEPIHWPMVRFVAEPDVDAAIRLDLASYAPEARSGRVTEGAFVESEGLNLGSAALEGEPGSAGRSYTYRRAGFTVQIHGSKAYALELQRMLWIELQRPDNYLLIHMEQGLRPAWLHTYQTQQPDFEPTEVYDEDTGELIPDRWRIPVTVDADPLLLGKRVVLSQSQDVFMSPSAVIPLSFAIANEILGDAPAPLLVGMKWSRDQHGNRNVVAVSRDRGYVWKLGDPNSWSAGEGTALDEVLPDNYEGNITQVTFSGIVGAPTTMATRISGPVPEPIANGRYRVLLRMGRSADGTFAVRFGTRVLSEYRYGQTVTASWNASGNPEHVAVLDLGVFSLPIGTDQDGTHTPDIAIDVQRLTGAADAWLDYLRLIPLDGSYLSIDSPGFGASGGFNTEFLIDSEGERFRQRNALGPVAAPTPYPAGGWPEVVPGFANVIHVAEQTSAETASNDYQDSADRIADSVRLSMSYRPRYLQLPAGPDYFPAA